MSLNRRVSRTETQKSLQMAGEETVSHRDVTIRPFYRHETEEKYRSRNSMSNGHKGGRFDLVDKSV